MDERSTTAWEFTDDRGHLAAAPEPPARVAAYIQAGASLWDLGIRPVGIFGSYHDGDRPDRAKSGALPLDDIAYLGAGADLGLDAVLGVRPDLVVALTYGGGQVYGIEPDTAKHLEEHVPVVVIDVGQGRTLSGVRERFAELGRSLGVTESSAALTELTRVENELAALTEAGGGARRVLALSPGGPGSVHLARPAKWPDLSALTGLGVHTVEPPEGPGANWHTGSWADAAELAPDIVLLDARANAAPSTEYAGEAHWAAVAERAVVLPWNPEIPASATAHAAFFGRLARALRGDG
ncbi:ABC transporter substrate-binding protein [Streptomyces sp. VRA16 Mangrove soil]|uniref:ABC transporter substrate-binding protein n=1 Tax=Streptomyces sp. VRA16 Mangrove soil TaxID=2817434 RepID=UPI001A9DD12F|nr:ABC transporter substrate-binding protein [Streptomyces sp. VRA16 Mangrove soil]MBO1335542.1 ABC transporter substrate-binding protein [Streptomyces sp. VRA16 Mangrove soil]